MAAGRWLTGAPASPGRATGVLRSGHCGAAASLAAPAKAGMTAEVVVHPVLIDRGERKLQPAGRLLPVTAIHGQQRELGFQMDDRIGAAQAAAAADASAKRPRASSSCPASRCASPSVQSAVVAPWAPGGLLGDSEGRVGHHRLRAAGTQVRPQHGPGRLKGGRPILGTPSNEAASTNAAHRCCPGRVAGQRAHPASQHRERWVAFDVRIADRAQPALNGRQLPGV